MNKGPWSVLITAAPYNLCPALKGPINTLTKQLFTKPNKAIFHSFIRPIKTYYTTKNLEGLAVLEKPNKDIYGHITKPSAILRLALSQMWRNFAINCMELLASSSPKHTKRALYCPPIGFAGKFVCKQVLCPNCYLRQALKLIKRLEGFPEGTKAVIVTCHTPFTENLQGFTPVDPHTERVRLFVAKLGHTYVGGNCRTLGVTIQKGTPHITTTLCSLVTAAELEAKLNLAAEYRLKLIEIEQAYGTKVTIHGAENFNDVILALYSACPVLVLNSIKTDFTDLRLQYTVNEYLEWAHGKKQCLFFGT